MGVKRTHLMRKSAGFVNNADNFAPLNDASTGITTVEANTTAPWMCTGTFTGLRIRLDSAFASGDFTVTVRVGGSDTALTVTLVAGETDQSVTRAIRVTAGQLVCVKFTPTSGAIVGKIWHLAVEFDSDAEGETAYQITGVGLSGGSTLRNNPFNSSLWSSLNETLISSLTAVAGSVTSIGVQLDGSPGAGTSYTFLMVKNGTLQDGSVGTVDTRAIVADAETTATATFDLPVVEGDRLSIQQTPAGSPTSRQGGIGIRFMATTDGESPFCCSPVDTTNLSATEYMLPCSGSAQPVFSATETSFLQYAGLTTFTLRRMRLLVNQGGAPGTAITVSLRQNQASPVGGPAVTVVGTTTASDAVGTLLVDPADTLDVQYASGSGSRGFEFGFCQFALATSNTCICPPAPEYGGGQGHSGDSAGDDATGAATPWLALCAGEGTVPSGTNGTDAEDWA